jgi:predicted DNA-binding protein
MADEMTAQVMIRLTPDLLDQLKVVSQEQERTVAQTVRLLIKNFLNESALAT